MHNINLPNFGNWKGFISNTAESFAKSVQNKSSAKKGSATGEARGLITATPANPKVSADKIANSKKEGVISRLSTFIQRADAWPYETKLADDGSLDKVLYQPGTKKLERQESGLSAPATSKLARFGFGMLKLAKDALLLGPRLAAGGVGVAAGLTMVAGSLLALPFSPLFPQANDLRGKLLFSGMTLTSTSLIAGLSSVGRVAGSLADLAQPITNKDVSVVMLKKVATYAIGSTQRINNQTALLFTGKINNPSRFDMEDFDANLNRDDDDVSGTESDTPLELTDEEYEEQELAKLQFGKSANKVMSLVTGLAGFFTLGASVRSSSKIDKTSENG